MELAGLALGVAGVVGLVPVVCQGYQRCSDMLHCARNLSNDVRKSDEKLLVQRMMFDRECRLLLQGVVSEEVADQMIDNHHHEMWGSEDFQVNLTSALGTDFDIHFKHIKASLDAIEKLLILGVSSEQSHPGPSRRQRAISSLRKFRYVVTGKENIQQLIDILRKQNQDLLNSRLQHARLTKSRAKEGPSKQPSKRNSPSMPLPHPCQNIQEISKVLYDGLGCTDICTCHVVNLQLDANLVRNNGSEIVTSASVVENSFQFVVTKVDQIEDQFPENCQVECTQLTVHSEVQATGVARDTKMSIAKVTGKSRVRFTIDERDTPLHQQRGPPTLFDNATIPSTQNELRAIRSLCSLVAQPFAKSMDPLGIIPSVGELASATTYRHLVYSDLTTTPVAFQTSLDEQLPKMRQEERLRLALALAYSLLNFGSYETSWFRERWRSKDIIFFSDAIPHPSANLHPYISPKFPCQGKGKETTQHADVRKKLSLGLARNEQLFSLALVLIEIGLRGEIMDIDDDPTGGGQCRTADPFAEYIKAKHVVESGLLASEMGADYGRVVKQCLFCDFGIGEADFTKVDLQRLFYRDVVCELEKCYKKFRGESGV